MDNRYYTPDIEDLRIGFHCEVHSSMESKDNGETWKHTWKSMVIKTGNNLLYNLGALKMEQMRVKYLTKKDIESEGWKVKICPFNILKGTKHTGNYDVDDDLTGTEYNLYYRLESNRLSIESYPICFGKASRPYKGVDRIYFGDCKSINEFKTIQKLLSI